MLCPLRIVGGTKTRALGAMKAKAEFNPLIRPYLVLYIGSVLVMTIVLIPLAILWFCGVGQWWARHYFAKLECELTPTNLRFRKGILFQVEKTIPLENIQDVTFIEGPLLKRFNLSVLKLETAGQSQGNAHDMRLIGIIGAHDFRGMILAARESLKNLVHSEQSASVTSEQTELLRTISSRLAEVVELMKKNS